VPAVAVHTKAPPVQPQLRPRPQLVVVVQATPVMGVHTALVAVPEIAQADPTTQSHGEPHGEPLATAPTFWQLKVAEVAPAGMEHVRGYEHRLPMLSHVAPTVAEYEMVAHTWTVLVWSQNRLGSGGARKSVMVYEH